MKSFGEPIAVLEKVVLGLQKLRGVRKYEKRIDKLRQIGFDESMAVSLLEWRKKKTLTTNGSFTAKGLKNVKQFLSVVKKCQALEEYKFGKSEFSIPALREKYKLNSFDSIGDFFKKYSRAWEESEQLRWLLATLSDIEDFDFNKGNATEELDAAILSGYNIGFSGSKTDVLVPNPNCNLRVSIKNYEEDSITLSRKRGHFRKRNVKEVLDKLERLYGDLIFLVHLLKGKRNLVQMSLYMFDAMKVIRSGAIEFFKNSEYGWSFQLRLPTGRIFLKEENGGDVRARLSNLAGYLQEKQDFSYGVFLRAEDLPGINRQKQVNFFDTINIGFRERELFNLSTSNTKL